MVTPERRSQERGLGINFHIIHGGAQVSYSFVCTNPKCGKQLRVPDTAVGKRIRCPACGQVTIAALANPSMSSTGDPDPGPKPAMVNPSPKKPVAARSDESPGVFKLVEEPLPAAAPQFDPLAAEDSHGDPQPEISDEEAMEVLRKAERTIRRSARSAQVGPSDSPEHRSYYRKSGLCYFCRKRPGIARVHYRELPFLGEPSGLTWDAPRCQQCAEIHQKVNRLLWFTPWMLVALVGIPAIWLSVLFAQGWAEESDVGRFVGLMAFIVAVVLGFFVYLRSRRMARVAVAFGLVAWIAWWVLKDGFGVDFSNPRALNALSIVVVAALLLPVMICSHFDHIFAWPYAMYHRVKAPLISEEVRLGKLLAADR